MPGGIMQLQGAFYCGCEKCMIGYYDEKIIEEHISLKSRLISADDKNQDCPITLCLIETGEKYYICPTCQYNFSADAITYIAENTYKYKEGMPSPLVQAGRAVSSLYQYGCLKI